MFTAARNVWRSLSETRIPPVDDGDADGHEDGNSSLDDASDDDGYDSDESGFSGPSFADVLVAKAMLQRACRLPLELVDAIVDLAEYWPHTHAEVDFWRERGGALAVPSHNNRNVGNNRFLLRTPPLGFQRPPASGKSAASAYVTAEPEPAPVGDAFCSDEDVRTWLPAGRAPALEHPCRKIVFTLVSHDQGWGGEGRLERPYRRSYSWFDVGLERYCERGGGDDGGERKEQGHDGSATPMAPPHAALRTIRPDVEEIIVPPSEPGGPPETKWQFSFPLLPGVDRLQSNLVASRAWTTHEVVWSWADRRGHTKPATTADHKAGEAAPPAANPGSDSDGEQPDPLELLGRGSATGDGEFVRNLRVGDVVTVWAKARFPGWLNSVQNVKVDVYWAV